MIPLLIIGTVIGFSGGTAIGDLITHGHSANLLSADDRREALGFLLLSLAPAITLTYFYHSRALIADKEATAQRAELQAAESQLKLLESQLEPHMLFNTLANLRVLMAADPRRAQVMLDQLIAFLRATLSGSRVSHHPLRTEFERLADYLSLMQVRMGTRLMTRFDLPDELSEISVPSLLLQPLVENSIKHGLEPSSTGGRIDVSAARDGDALLLSVRDTGTGISAQPVNAVSFGLANVRARLATLYGSQASLSLSAAQDSEGGALAVIRLPILLSEASP
jgi:LytS/YehU family sensor histidine kinase